MKCKYSPYVVGIGLCEDVVNGGIDAVCLYSYNTYGGVSSTVINHLSLFNDLLSGNCSEHDGKIISSRMVAAPWLEHGYEVRGHSIASVFDLDICHFYMTSKNYYTSIDPIEDFVRYIRYAVHVHLHTSENNIVNDVSEETVRLLNEISTNIYSLRKQDIAQNSNSTKSIWIQL